jgi:NarL family two-component system response regulator LiaR
VDTPSLDSIQVLVVDDHDLFRVGLAGLLSAEPDMDVVGQASGGRMGVRLALELRPDVVLMDLKMPDLDGAEATITILRERPLTRVVILTAISDDHEVAAALSAGACGFVVKDTPVDSVIAAVRAAAQGAAWLSPAAAAMVLDSARLWPLDAPDTRLAARLSPRELEVLRLLARGMENDEIANALHISPLTAKNHVSRILAKLELPSRVQAAIYAVRQGLDRD